MATESDRQNNRQRSSHLQALDPKWRSNQLHKSSLEAMFTGALDMK